MASDTVKSMLRSKGAPFSETELRALTDQDGWAWIYTHVPPGARHHKNTMARICFTGFAEADRAAIEKRAAAHFSVKHSVSVGLDYLITGPNPAPAKISLAHAQNTKILSLEQYNLMLMDLEAAAV